MSAKSSSESRGVVFGLTSIRRAEAFLCGPEGHVPSRDDLAEAFHWIWQALRFAELWPAEVREQAAELIVVMLRHGPYHETARRMSADEIRHFAGVVRSLVADAERRRDDERPSRRDANAATVGPLRRRALAGPG